MRVLGVVVAAAMALGWMLPAKAQPQGDGAFVCQIVTSATNGVANHIFYKIVEAPRSSAKDLKEAWGQYATAKPGVTRWNYRDCDAPPWDTRAAAENFVANSRKQGTTMEEVDFAFTPKLPALSSPKAQNIWICEYVTRERVEKWLVVQTSLSRPETSGKFAEFTKTLPDTRTLGSCLDANISYALTSFARIEDAAQAAQNKQLMYSHVGRQKMDIAWRPDDGTVEVASGKQAYTVPFASPTVAKWGYPDVSFSIEAQLIVCQGELHLAYSVVDDSVRQMGASRYLYKGNNYSVPTVNPAIASLPIKARVYIFNTQGEPTVGWIGDDFASKALAFGCFTGQTKKVADLKTHVGDKPTPAAIQAFLDSLAVKFETPQVLTNASVESDVETGKLFASDADGRDWSKRTKAPPADQPTPPPAQPSPEEEARQAEQVRAQYEELRRKAEEAKRQEQERIDTYNRQVAEHEKQLAENQRQVEAAAEARRQFEEKQAQYERDRAAWEAQVKATKK